MYLQSFGGLGGEGGIGFAQVYTELMFVLRVPSSRPGVFQMRCIRWVLFSRHTYMHTYVRTYVHNITLHCITLHYITVLSLNVHIYIYVYV